MPLPLAAVGGGGFAGGLCLAGVAKLLTGSNEKGASSSSSSGDEKIEFKASSTNGTTNGTSSTTKKMGEFPDPFNGVETQKKKAEGKVSSRVRLRKDRPADIVADLGFDLNT